MEKPSLPKGTRDFGPAVMAKRQYLIETIKGVFKKFGFAPLETPAMENLSTLTGKYGDEGDQLLFKILNSGDYLKDVDASKLETRNSRLLTGDISAEVEREILPRLTHAPTRILKVAHHGSRTSSSQALLSAWRPQFALISAGRGNTFGHPAPEVLQRLEENGATVLRTDLDGQITLETDGWRVKFATFEGVRKTAR